MWPGTRSCWCVRWPVPWTNEKAPTLEESRVAAFSRRLNFLAPAFQALAEEWLTVILKKEVENTTYIVDSCPVILAKGPRSGYAKAVEGLCAKSYNSSRKEWYYGVKLHAFVARKPGRLPAPMGLFLSGAAVHDLKAAKQILQDSCPLPPGTLYADKAHIDSERAKLLQEESAIQILTPRKKHKVSSLKTARAWLLKKIVRRSRLFICDPLLSDRSSRVEISGSNI